jgi:hypothetical protein
MVRRSAVVMLGLTMSLAACGDTGFKAKFMAACEAKDGKLGRLGTVDCACAADLMDGALSSDLKVLLVAITDGGEMTGQQRLDALKDAGIDVRDLEGLQARMRDFGEQMQELEPRLKETCKAG